MLKRATARIFLTLMWVSCGVWVAAQTVRQPLEQAAAREVKSPHPPGCLAAWPAQQALTGRLLGVVLPPFPEEDPPVPAKAFLVLSLDGPTSVCAAPRMHYPAYEDVVRVKIINLSLRDFLYVMRTWGPDDVRITSTLNTAETIGQEPGPVVFDSANFQFCWRPPPKVAHHPTPAAPNIASAWTCMSSGAWFKRLPGPHLP
jgi:hypothetical protein